MTISKEKTESQNKEQSIDFNDALNKNTKGYQSV